MKNLRAVLVLILCIAVLPRFSSASYFVPQSPHSKTTALQISIDFGNGTIIQFDSVNGTDVLDATQSVTSVDVDWYGDNAFVTSISGVPNDPEEGLWWQYWINDELGPVAANKYIPDQGDEISWRRVPPEDNLGGATSLEISTVIGIIALPIVGLGVILFLKKRKESEQTK